MIVTLYRYLHSSFLKRIRECCKMRETYYKDPPSDFEEVAALLESGLPAFYKNWLNDDSRLSISSHICTLGRTMIGHPIPTYELCEDG
ncbi:hypothetical protein AKJ16_DCAP13173 [Drosera capensis]